MARRIVKNGDKFDIYIEGCFYCTVDDWDAVVRTLHTLRR